MNGIILIVIVILIIILILVFKELIKMQIDENENEGIVIHDLEEVRLLFDSEINEINEEPAMIYTN